MKKIIFFLCLINNIILLAQTDTLVTPYGKKVPYNPIYVNTANNGLTMIANNIELGGTLTKPTTIKTDETKTLSIKGLKTGNTQTDQIIVAEPATGVLKKIAPVTIFQTEPWYNTGNNQAATQNTQNIYQMGSVGIGQSMLETGLKLSIKSSNPGAIQIEDTTQKNGFVLKSDSNGVGTWQVNDLTATTINGSFTQSGWINGTGYLGASIKLPPGEWAVYVGALVLFSGTPGNNINTIFAPRFTFSSNSASNSAAVGFQPIGGNSVIYNIITTGTNPAANPMFVTGCVSIKVTQATPATLYLMSNGAGSTAPGSKLSYIDYQSPENYIYAIKI